MRDERTKEKIILFETPKFFKMLFFSRNLGKKVKCQGVSFFVDIYIGDYTTQFYGDLCHLQGSHHEPTSISWNARVFETSQKVKMFI